MRRNIKTLGMLLWIFTTGTVFMHAQGYRIDVEIKGMAGDTLLLGYHFGDRKFISDTTVLDSNGKGRFTGGKKLAGGIYLVVLPDKSYFEIIIGNDQEFGVITSKGKMAEDLRFVSSPENDDFLEYQNRMVEYQKQAQLLNAGLRTHGQHPDSAARYQSSLRELNIQVGRIYDEFIARSPGSLLSHIVQAMRPLNIPDFDIPPGTSNPDSLQMVLAYAYQRDHFFDGYAWGDSSMLRTPILHNKLQYYISRLLIQHPDSLVNPVIRLIEASKAHPAVFQFVTVSLLNHFMQSNIMGHDKVYVRIAQRYYLSGQAFWADQEFLDKLNENVTRILPNLIGEKGHDLIMESTTGEWFSLHQVDADYIVLYFWEPDCGHCKTTTPVLKELYEKWKEKNRKVEVFAVYTQDDRKAWTDYLEKNGPGWINVFDPNNQSNFRYWYHVISTPTIFLLDRNKNIIAKRIPVESLGQMIDRLESGKGI